MFFVTSSGMEAGLEVQQVVCRAAWQRPILLGCVFSGHIVRLCAADRLILLAARREIFIEENTVQGEC